MGNECVFCRHGEIDNPQQIYYGRTFDLSLDSKGKETIKTLGEAIHRKKILVTSLFTSPMKRTIQSAEILSKILNVPITIHESLIDVNIPALAGKSLAIRKDLLSRKKDEYDGIWVRKGNEPRKVIAQRMVKAFHEIMDQNTDGIPLIVSHGDPLIFLLYALENPGEHLLSIGALKEQGYGIEKGQGLFVHLNPKRKVFGKEIIP